MLPVESWCAAMTLEPGTSPRPAGRSAFHAPARQLRRALGRGLIAFGQAVAGPDAIGARPVSVGR